MYGCFIFSEDPDYYITNVMANAADYPPDVKMNPADPDSTEDIVVATMEKNHMLLNLSAVHTPL